MPICSSSTLCLWLFLSTPAVLQGFKHPRGIDRSGGVVQPEHDQRFGQPSQHSGSVPVLEKQTAPLAAQRQRSAHHVSVILLPLIFPSAILHSLQQQCCLVDLLIDICLIA